jgi:hypothetical protein
MSAVWWSSFIASMMNVMWRAQLRAATRRSIGENHTANKSLLTL